MNAEQKEKEEAAWKAAHEASMAAAHAKKAYFEAIKQAREEDLASFLAGRARQAEQAHLIPHNGALDDASTVPSSPAPNLHAPRAPSSNSTAITGTLVPPETVAGQFSATQRFLDLHFNPKDEHQEPRSPSPFSELLTPGGGQTRSLAPFEEATRCKGGRPQKAPKRK